MRRMDDEAGLGESRGSVACTRLRHRPGAIVRPSSPGLPLLNRRSPSPWRWIPSLYFGQGLPFVVVTSLSVVMYKNLGVGNAEIALVTSWLYLPWVIKPLWGPLVDLTGTRRRWIVVMQFVVGAALAALAWTLPAPGFLRASLAVLWLVAFASATHDIAADGFYMQALTEKTQAAFVGVRSTFFRLSMIGGQGGLVWLAGWLIERGDAPAQAWTLVLGALAAGFGALGAWHLAVLPRPTTDVPPPRRAAFWRDALEVFAAFFRRDDLLRVMAFLLLYRFAEAQLLKLVVPFLLDPPAAGGLGLRNQDVGLAYGTFGVIALTAGGLLGGWVISRVGLKRALWPMLLAMNLPNLVYAALAWAQPGSLAVVTAALALEQFGYGYGFAAYLVFMLMVAGGPDGEHEHKTAHYALCTGIMALGMMLPGLGSGWLQQQLGYLGFFAWIAVATLPSFAAAAFVRIDPAFGRRG